MNKPEPNFKQEAHKLVDQLPDNATWYDLMVTAGERYDTQAPPSDAFLAADPLVEYD
jgi:hypothetical protein